MTKIKFIDEIYHVLIFHGKINLFH